VCSPDARRISVGAKLWRSRTWPAGALYKRRLREFCLFENRYPLSTYARHIRDTALLSGPVVAAQLGQTSMTFVDTIVVGRLGRDELAGVALGHSIFFFVFVLCMGVLIAVGPMVSQAFGAGDNRAIGRSVRQGLWLGTLLAIPAVLILLNARPILLALGQEEVAAAGAARYLKALAPGFFPALWVIVFRAFMEALGRPWPVTFITFAGVLLNVVANYTLAFGYFGFPALGLVGTGIASTIAYVVMFIGLLAYIKLDPRLDAYGVFNQLGRPDGEYFREIVRIGWPIGVTLGVETSLFTMTALLMGTLGTTALASHQIALQCAAFAFMVPLGIAIATSVRVGQHAGRADAEGTRKAGLAGMGLALVAMSLAALAFLTIPRPIVSLYIDLSLPENIEVANLAVRLLGIAAVFQLFDGLQVSAGGALRGLKDTRVPMIIGTTAYLLIGLGTGYVAAFVVGWGAPGLWWGLVLGLSSAAVLLTWRFLVLSHAAVRARPSVGEGS
jgi:multidrug resistance protein, MATE family